MGSIKAISTSKIRKIIVIKKNCREKGMREEDLGSNPHSKGDLFSRSIIVFLDKRVASIITINEIIIIIKEIIIIDKIIYIILKYKPYDWKSYILFILYKLVINIINYLPHQ